MLVIHHPYFIPWSGYFSKLVFADKLILLDDVLFSKRHDIDRCTIVGMQSNPLYLNVPCGQNMKIPIKDVIIEDDGFVEKILMTIEHSYKCSKLFWETWEEIKNIISNSLVLGISLSDMNRNIIDGICNLLEIEIELINSSEYKCGTIDATERIIYFCNVVNDKKLLVGDGKGMGIHDIVKLRQNGIEIYQQKYYTEHPIYFQCRRQKAEFLRAMSIVDALLNIGIIETKKILSAVKPKKLEV